MSEFLSTRAKRRKMADFIGDVASGVFGQNVALIECDLYDDEHVFEKQNFETARGECQNLTIRVCPRGVTVYVKFAAPQFAPPGANPHSGKWNHYVWPRGESSVSEYRQTVDFELRAILQQVEPNGATRQNLPDLSGFWAQQRAEFAAQCAAKRAQGQGAAA
jgi:hypothetical protein